MDKIAISIKTSPQNTISSYIADNKRYLIQKLTVVGPYQSKYDNDTIRKMCNTTNEDGTCSGGQLEVLDLVNAEIMDHQDGIYKYNTGSIWSSNSLKDCLTLCEIRFGKSLTSISGRDLDGCVSLQKIEVIDNPIYKSINGVLYQYADNRNWTISTRIPFGEGEWILIKVPATIQDSSLIMLEKISRIEVGAFKDTSLKSIIMPSFPPTCDCGAFSEEDIPKITLFVPEESFNSYWCHPMWGKFNIEILSLSRFNLEHAAEIALEILYNYKDNYTLHSISEIYLDIIKSVKHKFYIDLNHNSQSFVEFKEFVQMVREEIIAYYNNDTGEDLSNEMWVSEYVFMHYAEMILLDKYKC